MNNKVIFWFKRGLCCTLLLGIITFNVKGQQISFSNFTLEDGLSQNSVVAITQDHANFMWFGTRNGLNRFDGYKFNVYKNEPSRPNSISNSNVTTLLTDTEGTMWVGTADGLNIYNQKNDLFVRLNEFKNISIEVIYESKDKNIWIGTSKGLYLLVDKKTKTFKSFLFKQDNNALSNFTSALFEDDGVGLWIGTNSGLILMPNIKGKYSTEHFKLFTKNNSNIPSDYITAIEKDQFNNLWIGTDNGLSLFNDKKYTAVIFKHNNAKNSLIHNDIREIKCDGKGKLWIGTQEGLSIMDIASKTFANYDHDSEVNTTISHNSVHNIFQDVNRNMWIGTYFGGVNVVYPVLTQFKVYRNSRLLNSISGNVISSIIEDENKNLWIGTEGAGLNYFDRAKNIFRSFKTSPNDSTSITSNLVKIIIKENAYSKNLVVGTHKGGLSVFNTLTGKFKHIRNVRDDLNATGTAEILALQSDYKGTIWVGSINGLSTFAKKGEQYPEHTTRSKLNKLIEYKGVLALFEDVKRQLWIGTESGLYQYNPFTNKIKQFKKNLKDLTKLQSDYINCITQNSKGEVLVGTSLGLSIYDPNSDHFKTYNEKNGLLNDNVLGIIEDGGHNLWISTDQGLSELNLKANRLRNYNKSDGLAGNEFNSRSFFKDSNGAFFFGGINGLTAFYPKDVQVNTAIAPVVLTGLKLFNQPIKINGKDGLLKEDINDTKALSFKYNQNHFTIEFALLNYIKSGKNKYTYRLDGYDKDWIYSSTPSATYTNLPYGHYTFILTGLNNDGIKGANQVKIKIRILPPLWATWWAYIIYVLLFSAILFLTIRYFFTKALLKRKEDIQQMKLSFFTNVSHEIRTPLTLILAPLEGLLKETKNLPEINNLIIPIKNNADRLMRLITELMDFRKMETGHSKLKISSGNVVAFINEIYQSFQYFATSRSIYYLFEHNKDYIELWFDKKEMEKVLFNLISNAFKFTNEGGTIKISIEETLANVIIKVYDNGIGISNEGQDKLFTDFFQVDSVGSTHIGSGIGLALSKSIVSEHQGSLTIESTPVSTINTGSTCLTISLKKGNTHFHKDSLKHITETEISNRVYIPDLVRAAQPKINAIITERPETILIVEDNEEIRDLLKTIFIQNYQIEMCENGKLGLDTAFELLPDIIICDIMMPIMNGLELCAKIKTDQRTSHIPVILLTAKASHPHQLDGLETGADCYITKPFSPDLLKLHVRNLLQFRKNIREKYSAEFNTLPQNITVNKTDQAFMIKAIEYIEHNMAEQIFGVQELAQEMGMSQPVLYKKIRAITDLSVNDFIKSIRLKNAVRLLAEGVNNVSEISYLIGFNDPKYFSREFKKQYGHTPKEYVKVKLDQK